MSNSSACYLQSNIAEVQVINSLPPKFHVTKVVNNYKEKTEQQIKDIIQLEIDTVLLKNAGYEFVNSKSHFNGTGGIELQLNFELK